MAESLVDYILAIVEATRRSDLFDLGVSTRGTTYLYRAVQALAFVEGRAYGIPDDVKRLVPLVFSHRVILNRENSTKDKRFDSHPIYTILQGIPVPL